MNKLTAIIICCSVLLLGSCSDSIQDTPAVKHTIYRHALDGIPRSLDPAHASSVYASFVVNTIYQTLYSYKYLARPYVLKPAAAESMPTVSDDGLVYTIKLKPGNRFSYDPTTANPGGVREVIAEDFVYSIKRHYDPSVRSQGAWLWDGKIVGLTEWKEAGADYDQEVEGIKALDRYTIQIRLIKPFPQLVHTLTHAFSAIVPRESVEHYGREFLHMPRGSGPYKVDEYDGTKVVLSRNPFFYGEEINLVAEGFQADEHSNLGIESINGKVVPLIDRLEIHFIPEDAARWNALNSGDVDFARLPASQYDSVIESRQPLALKPEMTERFSFDAAIEAGFVHTDFNMADPAIGHHPDPAQDERNRALRCAINLAFDWQARNEAFYYGIGHVFPGILPPVTPEYHPDHSQEYLIHDVERAKKLLNEHGWTPDNLPVLEYGFAASVTERQMYEQFRSFLGEIGYPVEKIIPRGFPTFADFMRAYSNRKLSLITASWTMDYPDAENTVQLFYGPNATPGSNASNFSDERFDELYNQAATMTASPERTAIYREMNQIVIDQCATISGVSRNVVLLWDKELKMFPDRSFLGSRFIPFISISGEQ